MFLKLKVSLIMPFIAYMSTDIIISIDFSEILLWILFRFFSSFANKY